MAQIVECRRQLRDLLGVHRWRTVKETDLYRYAVCECCTPARRRVTQIRRTRHHHGGPDMEWVNGAKREPEEYGNIITGAFLFLRP